MAHIFISYSRKNQAYARKLAHDIRKRGFDVWMDDRIDYGDRWWRTLVQAVEDCAAFVVIMSPDAEKSEWVEREILVAQRERKSIFPILLAGREFALLITTQFADVTDESLPPDDFYERLQAVIQPTNHTGENVAPKEATKTGHNLAPHTAPVEDHRNWTGYAAIASVIVLILVGGLIVLNNTDSGDDIPMLADEPTEVAQATTDEPTLNPDLMNESTETPMSTLPPPIELFLPTITPTFALREVQARTGIDSWRAQGWTGDGRRVGVLDRGFGGLLRFEARYDVVIHTAYDTDKSVYDANEVIHGMQVVETLHSIAPNAEIHVCEYDSLDTFILCIDWMIRSDVHIINHSGGVPALPLDGTSRWAQEVDRVADTGVLWVNAAGNFGNGVYYDNLTDRSANRLHEFRGFTGEVEALELETLPNGGTGVVMLSWEDSDRWPNTIDLDLQIIDINTGVIIAGSYQPQTGQPGQQALELVRVDISRPSAVQIIDTNGDAAGIQFALFVEFGRLPGGSSLGSIITPADAAGSLTVTALQGSDVAPYASRGPLSTGMIKPDIAAPGEIMLEGGLFIGTNAAAPVVASAAALVWEANPDFSAQDIRRFLLDNTQDGVNVSIGQGRLLMPFPPPPDSD